MYDYLEDLEDSRWIEIDGVTVRLLKIPESLVETFKKKQEMETKHEEK